MGTMTRFDTATAVTAVGNGHYTAELDSGYLIGSAINGGYVMATMQRAALSGSTHPHPVSSSYVFLRPAAAGPADIAVTPIKTGRTVSTVQATVSQNETLLISGTIAAGTLDPAATPEYETSQPDIPPMERCHRFDPREHSGAPSGFPDRVEQYFTPDSMRRMEGRSSERIPELAGYIQLSARDGGPSADQSRFLPFAVDALPPVVTVLDSWRWAPTVELTWLMRAVPEPGPLMFVSRADSVNDGWFDETVDLWDVKGRLVAQSRQLARVGR
ncbi:thioesterase family protein [Halostreptopolyspora alba]|uniref:Thioesterase family protein n=2 Tax=Halostreptopolyspora alba TaxID=2487137 RepID=A0A3N0E9P3_9ACTN|nr:thioesterase family protein [Nocardiopsaceae bacterium YIM 96095]